LTVHKPMTERDHPAGMGGTQKVYRFANGYGASVVRFYGSYGFEAGNWELGVVKFTGDNWKLTYETPVTNDVIGYLTAEEVEATLDQIEALPAAEEKTKDQKLV
jgi:hypothetical protein